MIYDETETVDRTFSPVAQGFVRPSTLSQTSPVCYGIVLEGRLSGGI